MPRPEIHAPMQIVNVGENVWGGKVTINSTNPSPISFSGLSTKSVRSGGIVMLFPNNSTAATTADLTVTGVRLYADIPSNGTIRVFHAATGGDAQFSFLVLSGGTNLD